MPALRVQIRQVYAGIGWYLWYKYQIEDELRRRTGEGLGGAVIVLPFALGLSLGIIGQVLYGSLETLDVFSGAFWAAFVWIYVNQFVLYEKVNWVANKRFEISKFKFKFPRARTYEMIGLVLGCIEAKFCK